MYEKLTLENGVRVVWENVPGMRSVAVGIWVGAGSRRESAGESGAAHFIEHMLFKGTKKRTAAALAEDMDAVGGQVNAFTTKESTCFYARVLSEHLDTALDVLCDMFFSSLFDDKDVKNELGVILEEIDMYKDTPEDLVTEELFARVFSRTPLGRPILGKKATLETMDGAFLKDFMRKNYLPGDIVVALCGDVPRAGVDYAAGRFSEMERGTPRRERPGRYTPAFTAKYRPIEQNHICIAFPGLTLTDPERYAMRLLGGILGGGMSSRLFQTIREKLGLCYSVYSFGVSHADTGLSGVYAALSREQEEAAIGAILGEIRRLLDGGVTEAELSRAREQVKSNAIMSLESTSSRMNRLAKNELLFGYTKDMDEVLADYNAVTLEDVAALSRRVFDFERISFSAVGRVRRAEEYRQLLK